MTEKFIRLYLKLVITLAENNTACYSRKFGAIIVDPKKNKIIGTGYNGAPSGVPHCGSMSYINGPVRALTTPEEFNTILTAVREKFKDTTYANCSTEDLLNTQSLDCKLCPRRILGVKSGARMELCAPCIHAEMNAMINCNQDMLGAYMFGNFSQPCYECTRVMVQNKISHFVGIDGAIYSKSTQWLMDKGGITINTFPLDWVNQTSA